MSELSKRYEEQLLGLQAKWRDRASAGREVLKRTDSDDFTGTYVLDACADELQPFLDSLPALKKEWEREARHAEAKWWRPRVDLRHNEDCSVNLSFSNPESDFCNCDVTKRLKEADARVGALARED